MIKSAQRYRDPGLTFMAPELLICFLCIIFIKVIDAGSHILTVVGTIFGIRRYWCV